MLPQFSGQVFTRPANYKRVIGADVTLTDYTVRAYQYASSSNPELCSPDAIIYAANEQDVMLAIKYAKQNSIKIAVRSGGHQFGGASSTNGKNIQLDMSKFDYFSYDKMHNLATLGTGLQIQHLDNYFADLGVFVPHGQCGTVCVGGHLQSGGFSPFCGRSHGFFSDHVVAFRIITADLQCRTITRPESVISSGSENDEIWSVVLGGSPGNFGVVLDCIVRPLKDTDFPYSRAFTFVTDNKQAYREVVKIVAENSDDQELDADWNIVAFTMARSNFILRQNLDTKMMLNHPEIYGGRTDSHPEDLIGLWIVWTNVDGKPPPITVSEFVRGVKKRLQPFAPSLLLRAMLEISPIIGNTPWPKTDPNESIPMSRLSKMFVFSNRVHATPYVALNLISNKPNLAKNGYVELATKSLLDLNGKKGLYADFEHIVVGGTKSRNVINASSYPNSHSWRKEAKTFVFQYLKYDVTSYFANLFGKYGYWKNPKYAALLWVDKTRKSSVGPKGCVSNHERTWIAFSNQDNDLDEAKDKFFESGVWEHVWKVKKQVDPTFIFSPNLFCVGAGTQKRKEAAVDI